MDPPSKAPSPNEHLSFPAASTEPSAEASVKSAPQPRQILKDRLYVGNLHPTVDEYSLLQIFSKFGKVTKLDFLFHKAGALKGKPRGYAFIEYGNNDEALKALNVAHGKLLRGRKLVVTFAHQAPIEQIGAGSSTLGIKRKSMMETGRPTTLSMLKTGMSTRNDGTRDKIAMMEAKLRQMESTNPKPTPSPSSTSEPGISESISPLYHPSLPLKPPAPVNFGARTNGQHSTPKSKTILPPLPIIPQSEPQLHPPTADSKLTAASTRETKFSKLIGVKIGRPKEKSAQMEGD